MLIAVLIAESIAVLLAADNELGGGAGEQGVSLRRGEEGGA